MRLIIRLNHPQYDPEVFRAAGFEHSDLYFPDGSVPPQKVIAQFLSLVEACDGAVAVHCKAGLGRTGTLIAIYLMKHFRFCASDAIAWLRVMRPGSVLGPQQQFLLAIEPEVFALTPSSALWQSLPDEYRQFAIQMEETSDKAQANTKLSTAEMLIALHGDEGQGERLMDNRMISE